ncbi:MAG: amylo-alpha-1,6-glucosidase [Acidobacteriota bacterium]
MEIPREICRNANQALTREWLVTNGLGGYASSSIAGANTRRYHGLLVAALQPPSARTVMLSKLDEEVEVDGSTYHLATNEYETGTIHPDGYLFLERVELDGMVPTFYYAAAKFALSKTIWMEHGKNTTYVRYTLASDSQPIQLTLLPLCTYRDAHNEVRGSIDWHFGVEAKEGQVEIAAYPGAVPYRLITVPAAEYVTLDLWYWRFKHRVEEERGLDFVEDLYLPGLLRTSLQPGQSITVIATTESPAEVNRDPAAALECERNRQQGLAQGAHDDFEKQLLIAADQFIVRRQVQDQPLHTIIAGYPWFSDWGRDTMISLEGLTIETGCHAEGKDILMAFAQYVDQGMLPNRFPDIQAGATTVPVEYNNVDATLWYFHALDRYLSATQDDTFLGELFPVLAAIIDWHVKGTRYRIRVDPEDGLLSAGELGIQLTWMDAKANDWVVTPRIGKPVEINALWYHALRLMEGWARRVGASASIYSDLAARARFSFDRFWFREGGYLFDVVDGPNGNDASLRPNQLFALSLVDDLVPREQAKSILQVVERELLTPVGLRTLSPRDPHYLALYRGDQQKRDAAYHQGIVWPWLLGAYVDACFKVYGNADSAMDSLNALSGRLSQAGLGTLSEIHEAQPPHRAVGCIAQAWSVAEVLRAYRKIKAA